MALKKGASAGAKAAAANRAKAGSAASAVKAQNQNTFGTSTSKPTSSGSKTIQLNGQTVTATPYSQLNNSSPSSLKTTDTSATNQVRYINSKTGQSKVSLGGSAGARQLERQGYTLEGTTPAATDLGLKFETTAESYMNDKLKEQKNSSNPITDQAKRSVMEYERLLTDKTSELFGGNGFRRREPMTYDEWEKSKARELEDAQQQDLTLMQNKDQLARDQEAKAIGDLKRSQKEGVEGLKAAYGPNREGLVSTSNQMIPGAYQSKTQAVISLAQQAADFATEERSVILDKLRKAQENDQKGLAESLLGQLEAKEREILNYQESAATIAQTQATTEKTKQETTFSLLESMGSSVATLTTNELQVMGDKVGLTLPQMNNLKTGYQLKAQAAEMKDLGAARYAMAQADELIQSVKFEQEDRPLDVRIKQAEATFNEAEAKIKVALANGQLLSPLDQMDYAKQMYELNELRGYSDVSVPDGGDYAIAKTKDGIYVGVENGTYGGQCGAFVGDVNGKAFIPNLYTEKQKLIDKNIVVPVPGMVGIAGSQKYPQWGHVFIVEQVNNDGTMNIVESNYYSPEKVGRRTIPIASADGFTKMPNARTDQTNSDAGIYTKAQQAAMDSIDPAKITTAQQTVLKQNGLTSADLFNYVSSSKKALPEEKKTVISDILTSLEELKKAPGLDGAVGFSFQKFLPGDQADKGFIPGTQEANFKSKFDTFRDQLALPALDSLKGAMSDKDIQFLRNTATELSLNMSNKEFRNTLNKLKDKYNSILTQGSAVQDQSGEIDPDVVEYQNAQYNTYYNEL